MITVFIDTNIFLNEHFFRSALAQAFLNACALLEITVVIPDVVIDEVAGNFSKKLNEKTKSLQKSQKEVSQIIGFSLPSFNLSAEKTKYEQFLQDLASQKSVIIAPYPKIPAK